MLEKVNGVGVVCTYKNNYGVRITIAYLRSISIPEFLLNNNKLTFCDSLTPLIAAMEYGYNLRDGNFVIKLPYSIWKVYEDELQRVA